MESKIEGEYGRLCIRYPPDRPLPRRGANGTHVWALVGIAGNLKEGIDAQSALGARQTPPYVMRNLRAHQTVEELRRQISDLQKSLDELGERARKEEVEIQSEIDWLRSRGLDEKEIQETIDDRWERRHRYDPNPRDPRQIQSEITDLQRQLDEAQKTIVNFREAVSGGQQERFYPVSTSGALLDSQCPCGGKGLP